MATAATASPDTPSADYEAMRPYWTLVDNLLGGAEAMRAAGWTPTWRAATTTSASSSAKRVAVGENPYLPRFPEEEVTDYRYRVANAPFTNIFGDILANLAAKPFAEEVQLQDGAPDQFSVLVDDIDGRGNNLHKFAGETFYAGAGYAIDWIFVEYSKARPRTDGAPLTQADERAQGLRPYWVHIAATDMLAVYSEKVRGKEIFTHARWRECVTRRSGFAEVTMERIRVLDREPILDDFGRVIDYRPATFTVYERQAKTGRVGRSSGTQWAVVDEGDITIGEIALVPFITGKRQGSSWRFVPVLRDAAHTQVEHFQAEAGLKSIKELTAFPMLAGNGVQPALENGVPVPVPIGPRAVVYAPPTGADNGSHGEWTFLEPTAESLRFLSSEVDRIEKQLRELGRQPLTAQTGNLTVVTTAFAAQKGNSAVQQWALNLKDALEQALKLTAKWLNVAVEPEVRVFTDFALEIGDDKGPPTLTEARKNGDLSRRTYWSELQRRNILSADFDADAEEAALIEEAPDEDDAQDIEDAAA
jgi:hypothetical protein